MNEKIPNNLNAVSETLMIPLYSRAEESQRPNPLIKDEKAVEIVRQMDYDFRQMKLSGGDKVAMILRLREFDRLAKELLTRHPDSVVVHIGCGLDTCFERVDNQQVEWYDLDLPEVIELRKTLIGGEKARYHLLSCSVFEEAWLEALQIHAPRPFLFLAEGVLPYLEERQIKTLVLTLQSRFPGAELVFDAHTPFAIWTDNLQFAISGLSVRMHWGLKHAKDLESWGAGIALLEEWYFFDEPEPRLGAMQWMRHFPLVGKAAGIFHYRLGTPASK
jgi:O-methyltransferase involved in polyketide biosynthesis